MDQTIMQAEGLAQAVVPTVQTVRDQLEMARGQVQALSKSLPFFGGDVSAAVDRIIGAVDGLAQVVDSFDQIVAPMVAEWHHNRAAVGPKGEA